ALSIFSFFLLSILALLVASFFVSGLSDISFPLIALLFLAGAIASVLLARVMPAKEMGKALLSGLLGVAPAILLILMAMSIKQIVVRGGVMDTILFAAVSRLSGMNVLLSIMGVWLLILLLNFFIGSGSAKAFLVLPILLPIVDVIGLSRQLAVQAFIFGDGFSNLLYPTNAALMIGLGFSPVSYTKWLRWELPLQIGLALLSLAWLYLGYFLGL
ncbi:MAG TPA: Na+/H+ antiporter NhaC family protein, partial [Clostridia bacterium]|nr:Na+/H+ antiporter NhaC family protein [Clostridia bacterium]